MPPPIHITVRPATESDLPALLCLLLTSFRQFPLFSLLYTPLDTDLRTAKDTIFFWRKRLLGDLLDPGSAVVVAEVVDADADEQGRGKGKGKGKAMTDVQSESWRMLDWIVLEGNLSQGSCATPGWTVVGFAIWNVRVGHAADAAERERLAAPVVDFRTALRVRTLNLEGYLWRKMYRRKDQDVERYKAYLIAEEELGELFYAKSCYYLDNLCVDFRYQRMGIGGKLLEWGIEMARGKKLAVQTEAGPMGLGLYRKMGFEQIGVWRVKIAGMKDGDGRVEKDGSMLLPVMRRDLK